MRATFVFLMTIFGTLPAFADPPTDCELLFSHFAFATSELESNVELLKGLGFKMIDEDFTETWKKPWGPLVDGLYGKDVYGQTKRVRYGRMLWPSEGAEFWKSVDAMIKDGKIPTHFQPLFEKFPEFQKFLVGYRSALKKTLDEMGATLKGGQLGIEVFEVADSTGEIEAVKQPLLHYAFFVEKDNTVRNMVGLLNLKGWQTVFPQDVTPSTATVFLRMPGYEGEFGNGMVVEIRKNPWP